MSDNFCGTTFLLERMPDKLWLFRFRYLADIFLKMKKVSCYFKENNWQNLLPMIKFKLLQSGFFENVYLLP